MIYLVRDLLRGKKRWTQIKKWANIAHVAAVDFNWTCYATNGCQPWLSAIAWYYTMWLITQLFRRNIVKQQKCRFTMKIFIPYVSLCVGCALIDIKSRGRKKWEKTHQRIKITSKTLQWVDGIEYPARWDFALRFCCSKCSGRPRCAVIKLLNAQKTETCKFQIERTILPHDL